MALPTTPGACISCNKTLAWLGADGRSTNLDDAIDLVGTAAYGSSWDGVARLVIYLCDDCVRNQGIAGNIQQWDDEGELRLWHPTEPFEHAREDLGL